MELAEADAGCPVDLICFDAVNANRLMHNITGLRRYALEAWARCGEDVPAAEGSSNLKGSAGSGGSGAAKDAGGSTR